MFTARKPISSGTPKTSSQRETHLWWTAGSINQHFSDLQVWVLLPLQQNSASSVIIFPNLLLPQINLIVLIGLLFLTLQVNFYLLYVTLSLLWLFIIFFMIGLLTDPAYTQDSPNIGLSVLGDRRKSQPINLVPYSIIRTSASIGAEFVSNSRFILIPNARILQDQHITFISKLTHLRIDRALLVNASTTNPSNLTRLFAVLNTLASSRHAFLNVNLQLATTASCLKSPIRLELTPGLSWSIKRSLINSSRLHTNTSILPHLKSSDSGRFVDFNIQGTYSTISPQPLPSFCKPSLLWQKR